MELRIVSPNLRLWSYGGAVRRIALITVLAFGCATVRVPVGAPAEPADGAGVIAPPIVELWIESSEEVPPQLAEKTDGKVREALSEALAQRQIPANAAGAQDAVLFVREKAVALTEARHSQQTWAKVGIVAGIVVVVVALVAVAVSGGKGSSSSSKAAKVGSPKAATPVAVHPRTPAVPVAQAMPHVARAVPLGPVRYYRPSPIFIGFSVNFWIPPRPLILAPEPGYEETWYPPDAPPPLSPDAPPTETASLSDAPPPPDPEPLASVALQLPPLADAVTFPVQDRGFFAGPQTAIQLDLLDRATGQLLWSKAVSAEADPTDVKAMSRLLGEAFAGTGWARRAP
jgi:hypothetical protein